MKFLPCPNAGCTDTTQRRHIEERVNTDNNELYSTKQNNGRILMEYTEFGDHQEGVPQM